ncbi:MAG: hypothetical protein RR829_06925 [Oscillospiraceae bacterium]
MLELPCGRISISRIPASYMYHISRICGMILLSLHPYFGAVVPGNTNPDIGGEFSLKKRTTSLILAIFFLLSGCSAPQQPYAPPDYSGHEAADEAKYGTKLADLTKLKDGKPILVTEEAAADFSKKPFAGFDKKSETWGYDVRSNDISDADLSTKPFVGFDKRAKIGATM